MNMPSNEPLGQEPINPVSALVFRILFDEDQRAPAAIPAAQARIWAAIDALHKSNDRSDRISLLERVSEGLHRARCGTDPRQVREHFARLTDQWLGCATLQ
jgi:hypothetical protein